MREASVINFVIETTYIQGEKLAYKFDLARVVAADSGEPPPQIGPSFAKDNSGRRVTNV